MGLFRAGLNGLVDAACDWYSQGRFFRSEDLVNSLQAVPSFGRYSKQHCGDGKVDHNT